MYILEIKVDESVSNDIRQYYHSLSQAENTDSGVDLVCVETQNMEEFVVSTINFGIKCQMKNTSSSQFYPYYLYPRSSISKTPLIMANSVGIIDKDYRGNIMAKVRNIPINNLKKKYLLKEGDRLFQICSPDLSPLKVIVVDKLSETSRGEGCFGSTGSTIY
jgi:dUTP pyrophosphatase